MAPCRARRDAADRPHPRRPARLADAARRRARPRVHRERRARRVPLDRRRRDLDAHALSKRERGRDRSRGDAGRHDGLRIALADAPAAVGDVSALEWPGRRPLRVARRRRHVAADRRARLSERRARQGRARGRAERSRPRVRDRRREGRRALSQRRRGRDVAALRRRPAPMGARLVLLPRRCGSARRGSRLRLRYERLSFERRRRDVHGDQRLARRRRLSPALDRPDRRLASRARERPGHDRQRRRCPDVELLVQSADGTVLSRRDR